MKAKLNVDSEALKKLRLMAVAYSCVQRELFATQDAYVALTNIIVDRPDVIVNLVDTVRGRDKLASAVPAFLAYANIPYPGRGITGMVIGNNRHLFKELLEHNGIPTPEYKFIKDLRSNTPPRFDPPYIVKLNEGGGRMGIDNRAVIATAPKVIDSASTTFRTNNSGAVSMAPCPFARG